VVECPLGEFGTVRVQVEAYRAADVGGQVGDEPAGVGAAGGDDRADDRDGAVAPGRREARDAVSRFENPEAFGEGGQLPQQVAPVGAESRFVDLEYRRHVCGRGGARGFRAAARAPLAEAADEGGALADFPEAELGVQRLAEVGGEQGDGGVPCLGEQVRHQGAAEAAAAETRRDQHHAHRGEVRGVPGEHDSACQSAVRRVHAEGLGFREEQRPFRFLGQPATVDREPHAVLQVFGTKAADGRERNAGTVSHHAPRAYGQVAAER